MRSHAAITAAVIAAVLLSVAHGAAQDIRLVEAAKNRDRDAVQKLLTLKVDVNAKHPDGVTPLHWVVQWDDLELVNRLLRAGAAVNVASDYGVTPLALACTNRNAAIADALLKAGANPNAASSVTGETPLMIASRTGAVEIVRLLLDHGVAVDAKEPHRGQTALMWAAAEGHLDVARILIERKADVHAVSNAGFTPLLFAARTGELALVRFLLAAGATVNEAAADGTTALVIATVRSHTSLARFLLEQGADPNKGPGFTPLHWAAGSWGSSGIDNVSTLRAENTEWTPLEGLRGPAKSEFVKLLLEHSADPNARAKGNPPQYGGGPARGGILAGATPFFVAARAGEVTLMRLLVAAGADPRMPNGQGTTPLMVAAGLGVRGYHSVPERDAVEAVKICLELGNDVNAVDALGETALHGTAYRGLSGSNTIIQLLVEHGAKLNVKDAFGWTPLAIAEGIYFGGSDTRSDKMAELFRTLGAEPSGPEVQREGNLAEREVRDARDARAREAREKEALEKKDRSR